MQTQPTRAFGLLAAMAILPVLSSCGPRETLPPLLQNLEAHGGWADACPVPPELKDSVTKLGLADTPELDRRLQVEFPTGTPERALITKLTAIGFRTAGRCKDDQTIRIARYDQAGQSGWILFYPMTATVFWKVDSNSNIVWSKGFVFYTGL